MNTNKCDMHEKEIKELEKKLDSFKEQVSKKLEAINITLKTPILSDKQIAGVVITVVVYLVFTINYISGNNFRSINNSNLIEKIEDQNKRENEKMMDLLLEIKTIVDKNEGSKNGNQNQK